MTISEERVTQIDWLRDLAANIASKPDEGTAEELVEYALSDEGRDSWEIKIPAWFTDHDREILTRMVGESL